MEKIQIANNQAGAISMLKIDGTLETTAEAVNPNSNTATTDTTAKKLQDILHFRCRKFAHREKINPTAKKKSAVTFKAFDFTAVNTALKKLSKLIAKILACAVIWYVLGIIFPQLREILPAYYRFIDGILALFNYMCQEILNWMGSIGISL